MVSNVLDRSGNLLKLAATSNCLVEDESFGKQHTTFLSSLLLDDHIEVEKG